MKKVITAVLVIILIGLGYTYYRLNTNLDYNKIYQDFLHNKFESFFDANKETLCLKSDFDGFKDSVICDIDNDGIKELICVFVPKDSYSPEAMTVKYSNGKFTLGLGLDIDTNMGMGSAWFTEILEKDDLYYIYHLDFGKHYDSDKGVTHTSEEEVLYIIRGNKKEVIRSFDCSDDKMYLDGKEVNDRQDIKDGYTVVFDSRKYV